MKGFELLAKFMHDRYEEEARKVGWNTQDKCKVEYRNLPKKNRQVMDEVAKKVIELFADNKTATNDKITLNCIREEVNCFNFETSMYPGNYYMDSIKRIKLLLEDK